MIKLFATDLDGTLMNKQHESDDYILAGAAQLQNQGYVLATATGRSLGMLQPESLPGFHYICMNGALILDPETKILDDSPIDPAIVEELYDHFDHMPLEFCTKDTIYSRMSADEVKSFNLKHRGKESGLIPISDMDKFMAYRKCSATKKDVMAQPVYKINCMYTQDSYQDEFDAWLKDHDHVLSNAQSLPILYEITARDVNKAYGVRHLARKLGLTDEECAVFGDGGNDIAMLEAFENSYCPDSGSKEAREAARNIIGPYDEYSVINKMKEIGEQQGPLSQS